MLHVWYTSEEKGKTRGQENTRIARECGEKETAQGKENEQNRWQKDSERNPFC